MQCGWSGVAEQVQTEPLIPAEGWVFLLVIVGTSLAGAAFALDAWDAEQEARGTDIEACRAYCAERGGELAKAVVLQDKLACRCVFP